MPRLAAARPRSVTIRTAGALATVCALALLGANARPAAADTLSRSADVKGTPAQVWALIGPFCAIQDWHPAIGACTQDGKTPPTRTLVTKDGATFVELQTGYSFTKHRYSYTFTSSPLPVTHYASTFEVVAKNKHVSTVTWSSTYTPDPGKEQDAKNALNGIYETGLDAIKTKLAN